MADIPPFYPGPQVLYGVMDHWLYTSPRVSLGVMYSVS